MGTKDNFYDTLSLEEHLKLEGHQLFREYKANLLRKFLPQKSIIFDVGCGSGFDLKTFMQQGFDAIGLDISLNMLRQACKYLGKADIDLLRGDALNLPFRDDVFSAVHSHELSTFNSGDAETQIMTLTEQLRVCKDCGIIIIVLPTKDYPRSNFRPTSEEELKYLIRHAEMSPLTFIHLSVDAKRDFVDAFFQLLTKIEKTLPTKIRVLLRAVRQGYLKEKSYWIIAVCILSS